MGKVEVQGRKAQMQSNAWILLMNNARVLPTNENERLPIFKTVEAAINFGNLNVLSTSMITVYPYPIVLPTITQSCHQAGFPSISPE